MSFGVTLPTDGLLRPASEPRLFELYHVNTKLPSHRSVGAAPPAAPSPAQQYVMSRGFRQFRDARTVTFGGGNPSQQPVARVLRERRSSRDLASSVALEDLGTILDAALGCTAVLEDPETGLVHGLRAWPSAGGLYPLDPYIVARDVAGVDAGLYHYNAVQDHLELLASREPDAILADAYFDQDFATTASVAVLLVACFERTVAKYGERGYRLVMLDAGHAAQNLVLAASQMGVGAVPIAGFCDDSFADDLGVDGVAEAVVHTVLLGRESRR